MNFQLVIKQLGMLLVVLSICMLLSDLAAMWMPTTWGDGATAEELPQLIDSEIHARQALGAAAIGGIVIGGLLWLSVRRCPTHLGRREALLLVGMSWLIGATLAAMPFFLWAFLWGDAPVGHPFRVWINCYFESMSGLTTTGATVLSNIEEIPPSLLFWRSLTHWLGGLGIVLLFVAILPSLGVGGKRLFRLEAPGPDPEGVRPHIRDTARVLWFIYLGLTVAEVVALSTVGRMSLFNSFCHTFGTLATGGFSTYNASIGAKVNWPAVDVIIIIFMVLAGANFGLYFQAIRGKWKGIFRDTELRVYLALLFVGSAIVIASIYWHTDKIMITDGTYVDSNLTNSVHQGLFTTISVQTTTGYCTSDFNQWPFLAKAVLVMLMFVGGCAGSTGGGIKVIRVWVALKIVVSQLEHAFRPNVVRPMRVGGTALDQEMKLGTVSYVLAVILLFILGSTLVMLFEQAWGDSGIGFTTASTSSVATLCTIGPGLAKVGAVENYGWFCWQSKTVMCFLMALGRLEIFAILVLFLPRFWRSD